jgi:hypothetical protein
MSQEVACGCVFGKDGKGTDAGDIGGLQRLSSSRPQSKPSIA